jgi:biopolymer transport protein TolR
MEYDRLATKSRRKATVKRVTTINITPMVDVMTVLLSVFMVTAPLLTSGMEVNLPKGGNTALTSSAKSLDITVDTRGRVFIGTEEVAIESLPYRLKEMRRNNPNMQVVISGDKNTNYGKVIQVMGELKSNGFEKVGLKTEGRINAKNKK